jgi:hypothetical protein
MSNLKFKDLDNNDYSIEFKKPDARSVGQCSGYYYYPQDGEGTIHVDPKMSHQMIFNTVIHEVTHAFFDDATETDTTRFANCLSRLLYNNLQFKSKDLKQIVK